MIFAFVLAAAIASAPSPSPSPTPAPADPCGGPTHLLATLNRPTIGYSACAVTPGSIVLEEGYQSQINGTGATSAHLVQYPQSFIRYGYAPRFELDLIGPNDNALSGTHGYSDGGLGFKYEFAPSARTTIGVDGLYTTPNGSPAFTSGGATETVNLDLAYALSSAVSLGSTIAVEAASGLDSRRRAGRYGAVMPSFVVTDQLPNALQLYGEYVYASRLAPDVGGRAFLDGGVQKLIGPRVELDLELGQSLTGDPNLRFHYLGVGFGLQI